MRKFLISTFFVFVLLFEVFSQDSYVIKVHFPYGSKPKKEYKYEKEWFGGLHGGHVGIEFENNKIIDFISKGKFHFTQKKEDKHSRFSIRSLNSFWCMFTDSAHTVKKASLIIPISIKQKEKLDSIVIAYSKETPYDYAFWGMRCASATYDILSQINIVKEYSYSRTYRKIFYPKKLRKILFKLAKRNQWIITREEGTHRRKWEKN